MVQLCHKLKYKICKHNLKLPFQESINKMQTSKNALIGMTQLKYGFMME